MKRMTFFQQASLTTSIIVFIFFLTNMIGYAVDKVAFSAWIMLENTWALPIFGVILLVLIFFERKQARYFQAFLFFLYGFVMIAGKGMNYDAIPLFFVGALLLRKYNFFLKNTFLRLSCVVISISGLCYLGYLASCLAGKSNLQDVHRSVALIIATTALVCVIFRDDIITYQDQNSKRESEKLRQAGRIMKTINATLYRLLSIEKDKSENINGVLDLLKFVDIYSGEEEEPKIEANLPDYIDFALIFAGGSTVITKYNKAKPVKIYRRAFLSTLTSIIIKAVDSMENRTHKILKVSLSEGLLTIEDCGAGLTKAEMRTLFECDDMAHVLGCIKKHGWEISVESTKSVYTKYVITMPLPDQSDSQKDNNDFASDIVAT